MSNTSFFLRQDKLFNYLKNTVPKILSNSWGFQWFTFLYYLIKYVSKKNIFSVFTDVNINLLRKTFLCCILSFRVFLIFKLWFSLQICELEYPYVVTMFKFCSPMYCTSSLITTYIFVFISHILQYEIIYIHGRIPWAKDKTHMYRCTSKTLKSLR